MFDFVASLPIDYLATVGGGGSATELSRLARLPRALRLLRLVRLAKLVRFSTLGKSFNMFKVRTGYLPELV